MELFKNLIYEYKKGMRDLALYTCESDLVEEFIVILENMKIQYLFINLPKNKSNLFFGNPFCLEIVRRFSNKELSKLSPYEDFILGIMLGYSRNEQYHRVLSRI